MLNVSLSVSLLLLSVLNSPPRRRGCTYQSFECARECSFGFITYVKRDGYYGYTALAQQICGHLHPPLRQVLHRRLPDELRESFIECRARQGNFVGQYVDCPWARRVFVYKGERASHVTVAESGEPPRAFIRQPLDMALHRIDEHHLADALKHRLAAGTLVLRCIDGLPHDLADPRTIVGGGQVQQARECRDKWIERPQVATEKTARDMGRRFMRRRFI